MQILKNKNYYLSMLFSFATLIFLYYPISDITLSYFHNDDLLLIGRLNNLSNLNQAINFIFNIEYFKFRPIANLIYLIEYYAFSDNYNFYIIFNICLVLLANHIFLLFFVQEKKLLTCIFLSLILVSTKFYLYTIWNITGSFEGVAIILFLLIVRTLFSNVETLGKRLIFLSLLLILTSERYLPFITLLPVLAYWKKSDKVMFWSVLLKAKYSAVILSCYFAFRYLVGMPLIVGTQTDDVIESFSITRVFFHVIRSYSEIFGFSIGPKYLTGFEFVDWVPFNVLINDPIYIYGFIIGLLLLIFSFYYYIFKSFVGNKSVFLLNFIGFILIMAASITFRLELRWLLPSYLMLLLLFSTHSSVGSGDGKYSDVFTFNRTLFISVISLSVLHNIYYAIFLRRSLYFAEKLHDASFVSFFLRFFN